MSQCKDICCIAPYTRDCSDQNLSYFCPPVCLKCNPRAACCSSCPTSCNSPCGESCASCCSCPTSCDSPSCVTSCASCGPCPTSCESPCRAPQSVDCDPCANQMELLQHVVKVPTGCDRSICCNIKPRRPNFKPIIYRKCPENPASMLQFETNYTKSFNNPTSCRQPCFRSCQDHC